MKIYLSDQQKKFSRHLEYLMQQPVTNYDPARLKRIETSVTITIPKALADLDLECLFSYRIFPEHIMTSYTQWAHEYRTIRPGDTIVQQAYLPPLKQFSQKLVFGVRIKDVIDTTDKKGFSYETLNGHVEKGISTFTVQEADGKLAFVIETWSGAGNILAGLVAPLFSRPYQAYCTRCALQHVKAQLEMQG